MRRGRLRRAICLLPFALCALAAAKPDDRFIEGYAAAVLERDLGLQPVAVRMHEGVLVVYLDSLRGESPSRVRNALEEIRGVESVEIRRAGATLGEEVPDEDEAEEVEEAEADVAQSEPLPAEKESSLEFFPRRELFDPLLADVRWPNFSASYQWYIDDPKLGHVGSANFAETFALVAGDLFDASRWEVGLQAGVFSIFDLDAPSSDLINSDFLVGPTFSTRSGPVSTLLRVFHQSSHLGDEYLLRVRPTRVDLSYEAVDGLLSIDLDESLRVYAGGGNIFHDSPDLAPWYVQAGVEVESPWTGIGGRVRPVAAVDMHWAEQNHWDIDISVRTGLLFENPRLSKLRLRLLFEYFQGHSPNGQFFDRQIEYVGVGLHADL